jgi:biopolymer transport protein ExbB
MNLNIRKTLGTSALILGLVSIHLFAQVDLVKQQAEINSAKADLEDARKVRDQAVAERWDAKKNQNDERESLSEKQREAKEKLDALATERARLFEDVRASREDLGRLQEEAERRRTEFLTLSSQQDRAEALTRFMDQGVPFNIPERIQSLNQLKKSIDLHRDDPGLVASQLLKSAVAELRFTRQVDWAQADLVFQGDKTIRGDRARLGSIGAVQYEPTHQIASLMLPSAGERGRVFGWQENLGLPIKQAIGKGFFESRDSAMVMFPVDILLSTSLSTQMATATEMGWKDSLKKWFRDGGVIMYPISGIGILAFLMVLERLFVLAWKGRYSKRRLRKVLALAQEGKIDEAKLEGAKLGGSVGKVVHAIFRYSDQGRTAAEKAVEDVFAYEVLSLERRLGTIAVFGSTAPLLGLLGTVMGMIELFGVITLYGSNDPKLLAGGIAVALVATEAGLLVAIPSQLLHAWVANSVDHLVGEMESCALKLMNGLWLKD